MKIRLSILGLLLLLSIQTMSQQVKALVGGTLIDGFGGTPIRNSVIIVEGERIKAIGQVGSLAIPEGAEVISTEGMSVLPGLWDMHVHLMLNGHSDYTHWDSTYIDVFESVIMPSSAHQLLMAGVTSARDLGAPLEASINVRERIKRGEIPGPTIYVSGPFIQKAPYPGTEAFRWGVNGAADARAKVKKLIDAGVDVIKLIDQDQMTLEEAKAVVDEAHKYGKMVVGHSHRPDEIRIGLQIGVDNFEHTGLSSAPEYPEDIMLMMKERAAKMNLGPLFWTPTVEGLFNYEYVRDNPEKLDDTSWHLGLPDSIIRDIRASLRFPGRMSYFQLTPVRKPTLDRKFAQLKESGVVMLVGTDSGIPMKFHSQSTWNELDVWVNHFGMDPLLTIKAATYWPAVAMKVDKDYGTISEGKYADIIAVRGDVLRYINLLQDVDMVMKHGKKVK
ncbi:Xaa-Pro dipeptidase [Algoriphagus lacus]|uniref:Xaa-Pro dipeptidase n=2 Tax=Algoriphagus lacus TaxID=2056311 RepID=A0A418PX59_9BACT|nr:Xaa-Pro dipeptidase [Algoriphagus lacus]